ncbi:maleylpyruvate isomerase N-terminal domain-containing protein [Brachybacterium sp. DNPG3]
MDLFILTWTALREAVAATPDGAFDAPSGCTGWRIRDLVAHLVIDAQDVLITLSTPADDAPTADALSYWTPRPTTWPGDAADGAAGPAGAGGADGGAADGGAADVDPLDALVVRLATAYEDPALLRHHLEDLGAAAGRAALLAHPELPVATQGMSLTVRDYLQAYVLEGTLHHLDLVAGAAEVPGPPAAGLAEARRMLERRIRLALPQEWSDADALRIATGRRAPSSAERADLERLGPRAAMLPLSLS